MKRIDPRKKQRIITLNRARDRKRRVKALVEKGVIPKCPVDYQSSIALRAPKILSLKLNYEETLDFFIKIKNLGNVLAPGGGAHVRKMSFEISLSDVEHISVRSAVIFAAEVDRLRRLTGLKLEYTGRASISEDVTSILAELGCFSLMGIEHPEGSEKQTKSRKTLIKMLSGRRLDGQRFDEFDIALSKVFSSYRTLPPLYEGMGEALLNVRHHAYMSGVELKYRCPGNRWWATACLDHTDDELRIFVFDQGVGIPATLPYSGYLERTESILKGVASGHSHDDATLLKGALEYSRTRTSLSGRGKGFRNIMSAIDRYKTGRLRIASGKAEVTYCGQNDIVTTRHDNHIGGTLIEWALPVSVFEEARGAKK